MLVVEPPTDKKVLKGAPPVLGLVLRRSFPSVMPLDESPFSSRESTLLKAQLESRIEAFSSWLVRQMGQNRPPIGPELDVHLNRISEAVLELHRLEPEAAVLRMARESLKNAVRDVVFEVHGESFNAKFNALVRKWGDAVPSIAAQRDVYSLSTEHLSAEVANKIGSHMCRALDAIVIPAMSEQALQVA